MIFDNTTEIQIDWNTLKTNYSTSQFYYNENKAGVLVYVIVNNIAYSCFLFSPSFSNRPNVPADNDINYNDFENNFKSGAIKT